MPPNNVRRYSHKALAAQLPRHELDKDDTNGQAKVDEVKPTRPRPYKKNYRQPRNAGRVIQYQKVSPENVHTSHIKWNEEVIFRNMYVCVYTYICNIYMHT